MKDFKEMSAEFLDWVSSASLDELRALFGALEARLGVKSMVPFFQASYSIILVSSKCYDDGGQRIPLIKEIRALTHWGLKESKDAAEGHDVLIKSGMGLKEAEEAKSRLGAYGANIRIIGDEELPLWRQGQGH